MTKRELLNLADRADPETMSKVATALALVQKESPEFLGELTSELDDVLAFTEDGIQKVAAAAPSGASFFARAAGKVGAGALTLAGASALAVGGALATDLYDAAKRGLTKGRNYKRIIEANPDLVKKVNDKAKLRMAFDTFHRFAPDITADPMMGGAVLGVLANMPQELMPEYMQRLIGTRKDLAEIKSKQYALQSGIGEAVKSMREHGEATPMDVERLKAVNATQLEMLRDSLNRARNQSKNQGP